ncbi:hypothetical protein RQP46_005786 [Phenoliferia psychrophenolica]
MGRNMRDRPCAFCMKRPSEIQGGGEFSICGSCREASFCSAACQKKAWPIHKTICKTHTERMNRIEIGALSDPLATGALMSARDTLQLDILPELKVSLASAFRIELLNAGGCLAETHAAHFTFRFDRRRSTVRKQFKLVSGRIETFDEIAAPFLPGLDPRLAYNLSPEGLRAWNPWINAIGDKDKENCATVSCLLTVFKEEGGYSNMILPVPIHLANIPASNPGYEVTKEALLEADDGWLDELKSNLEQPRNDLQKMRISNFTRRVNHHLAKIGRQLIDEAMAHLGDQHDAVDLMLAWTCLGACKLVNRPDDPNYEHWEKAMEKVESLMFVGRPDGEKPGWTSEVSFIGEFEVCGRCRTASFCSAACQKKAWPIHKTICKTHTEHMNYIERKGLSNPLTTGLIVSAGQALQLDILPELKVSLASAFRVQLLSTGGCLANTHAAHLVFRFDRLRSTVRKQFRLTSAQVETFDKIAEPFLLQNGADPRLAYNLSPQGLRAWNPSINANAEEREGKCVTISCLITVMDYKEGYYNMILPVPIHPAIFPPDASFDVSGLLEADDGWLEELRTNLEKPRNDFKKMRARNLMRRVTEHRKWMSHTVIDDVMARLGDKDDDISVLGAYLILSMLKLEDKPDDLSYPHWEKAMEKVEGLMLSSRPAGATPGWSLRQSPES